MVQNFFQETLDLGQAIMVIGAFSAGWIGKAQAIADKKDNCDHTQNESDDKKLDLTILVRVGESL